MRLLHCCGPAALVLLVAASAAAQPTTPTADSAGDLAPSGTAAPLSMVDGNFLGQAAGENQAEVAMARIAEQRAGRDGIRRFAQLMQRDHMQLARQLQVLARQAGIQVPASFSQQQQATESRLTMRNGSGFDRAYLDWVVRSQQASTAAYRHEADAGGDPAVRSYAQQALPMLQAHVNRARQLQAGAS